MVKIVPGSGNYFKCDVLIIGAGPAGAGLAVFLCGQGIDVLLIDKKKYIEQPVRCAGYVPAGFAALFDFRLKGIDNSIEKLETFINSKPFPLSAKEAESAFISELKAPGYIIDRKIMIRDWVDRFIKNGGRYFPCTKATGIIDGTVTASMAGMEIQIKPRIIVGADGPLSITGRHAGSVNTHFLAGINFKYKNTDSGANSYNTKVFFLPEIRGGYAWIFPGKEFINYGLGVDLELFTGCSKKPGVQKNLFDHIFGSLFINSGNNATIKTGMDPLRSRTGFASGLIPVSGIAAGHVNNNIILTGDAAGLCNPVTGAGIYNAVMSSKIAAKYIKEAVARKDNSVLQAIKKDYSDYFKGSLERALAKRKEISEEWRRQRTDEDFERFIRKTWMAFSQYWH